MVLKILLIICIIIKYVIMEENNTCYVTGQSLDYVI